VGEQVHRAPGTAERPAVVESCQGRSLDQNGRRVRACSRSSTIRVMGTHRLTVDLCAQHARVAADRPRLVREWLLWEGVERAAAGLPPLIADSPARGPRSFPAEPDLVLRVAAELASLAVIRVALSRALQRHGWDENLHPPVLLAVGEAVINAIEHGSSVDAVVEVKLKVTPSRAAVQVADEGRLGASMPLTAPVPPASGQVRGRGRLVMVRLADVVRVRSDGHGTSVLLQFDRVIAPVPGIGDPREETWMSTRHAHSSVSTTGGSSRRATPAAASASPRSSRGSTPPG
jgi:anti-sigma regulatory factor (Ser/Thr protein kinase)